MLESHPMATRAETIATNGLIDGYAGNTQPQKETLGGLQFNTSQVLTEDSSYFDLWLKEPEIGMGMETAMTKEDGLGRQYAGGIIANDKALHELGISKKQIIQQLKVFITNIGDKTRLYLNCPPILDGRWTYKYEIHEHDEDLNLVIAKETILYDTTKVFVHRFQILPVK